MPSVCICGKQFEARQALHSHKKFCEMIKQGQHPLNIEIMRLNRIINELRATALENANIILEKNTIIAKNTDTITGLQAVILGNTNTNTINDHKAVLETKTFNIVINNNVMCKEDAAILTNDALLAFV